MTKEQVAEILWGGFYRCPNSGVIIAALKGDDKVLCTCGQSNPKVPQERTHETGTHIIRLLEPASATEFIANHPVLGDHNHAILRPRHTAP